MHVVGIVGGTIRGERGVEPTDLEVIERAVTRKRRLEEGGERCADHADGAGILGAARVAGHDADRAFRFVDEGVLPEHVELVRGREPRADPFLPLYGVSRCSSWSSRVEHCTDV